MAFLPGNSGRPKGAINKATRDLQRICDEKGINPFEALLDLTKHEDVTVQLSALKEVSRYLYPTLKAVEISKNNMLEGMSPQEKLEAMREAVKVMEGQLGSTITTKPSR